MSILHLAVLLPFLIAIIIPIIFKTIKRVHTGWVVLAVPVFLFCYFLTFLPLVREGEAIQSEVQWVPSLGINFTTYLDGLALLFVLMITGVGSLVVLYSIFYLDKSKEKLHNFYTYLLMFMGAMLGIVLSDNFIVLYIFWELTSLSSALLISYWHEKNKSIYGARKSMLITVFGGFSMLAGFILLYVETGTLSIQGLISQADMIKESPYFIPAMILILLGAFTKSAQFPFHIWLPDAMEAPTPVSAYLHSATMVKAGLYLVATMTPVFGGSPVWFWLIVITGLVTLVWGALLAVRQQDLKGILAFSTISQLGLMMTLLGIGSASMYESTAGQAALHASAITTMLVHMVNHATFKGSLFMAVGIIDHETGTRDINKLGGLMSVMPVTFTISLVGLAAMAGIPPFNGFISKEKFFTEMLAVTNFEFFNVGTWGIILPVIAWAASIFTFLYCAIFFFKTFTGRFKKEVFSKPVHEANIGLLISPVVLGLLVIVMGIFPNLIFEPIIEPAVLGVLPQMSADQIEVSLSLWHGVNMELVMTIGVIAIGAFLYKMLPRLKKLSFFSKEKDPFNLFYEKGIDGLSSSSSSITKVQITDRLRDYFVYMLIFMIGILGYTFYRSNSIVWFVESTEPAPLYVYGMVTLLIVSTLSLLFLKERLALVISIGVIGFIISLLFTVFSAQDLALTQLLIETVTIVLLLLTFKHLPEVKAESASKKYKTINGLIAVSVGLGVFLIGISAFALRTEAGFTPVSEFFVENSYSLAGGENMVNVILVDFRGLDTILEVLVLAIVGLAAIMMIKHRFKGGEDI